MKTFPVVTQIIGIPFHLVIMHCSFCVCLCVSGMALGRGSSGRYGKFMLSRRGEYR